MSLLETIKNLYCKIMAETSAPAQEGKPSEVKVSEQDVVEQDVVEQDVVEQDVVPVVIASPTAAEKTVQLQIPEDSTLKRHFIANLTYQIESEMPPRPTESTLKRHYDSTVQSKLDDLLG